MSKLPRASLAYAKYSPSGDRLGLVSTPAASVSCVNDHHPGSADLFAASRHVVAAVTSTAAASTPSAITLVRLARVATSAVVPPVLTPGSTSVRVSASANFSAVANRSAGSLASAVSTARSTARGTVSRTAVGAVGRSVSTLATIACTVDPLNGGSPVSISYVTAPSE